MERVEGMMEKLKLMAAEQKGIRVDQIVRSQNKVTNP